jgi:transposase
MTQKYHKKSVLRNLYWDKKMSQSEIADRFDVSPDTIQKWMKRNNIETRSLAEAKLVENLHPSYYLNGQGYEVFQSTYKKQVDRVRHNNLLAIAEYGWDEVVEKDHVHHKNGLTWGDWPSNVEPLTEEEHAKEHHSDVSLQKRLLINELHFNEGLAQDEISDSIGVSQATVSYWKFSA